MYIDRQLYLDLHSQNELLLSQNEVLYRENQLLAHQLEKQRTANKELMEKIDHVNDKAEEINKQTINQHEIVHNNLKEEIRRLEEKQKKFIGDKIEELQNSSFQKYKALEVKNTANRIENHQLADFCLKLKKTYQKSTKDKNEPSLKDLLKWVKSSTDKNKQVSHLQVPSGDKIRRSSNGMVPTMTSSTWQNQSS